MSAGRSRTHPVFADLPVQMVRAARPAAAVIALLTAACTANQPPTPTYRVDGGMAYDVPPSPTWGLRHLCKPGTNINAYTRSVCAEYGLPVPPEPPPQMQAAPQPPGPSGNWVVGGANAGETHPPTGQSHPDPDPHPIPVDQSCGWWRLCNFWSSSH
jgi:hypothetical protein